MRNSHNNEFGSRKRKLKSPVTILADFLISRLELSGFGTGHGMWTAIYAVEEIKKIDNRCGGRTRSALIKNNDGHSIAEICEDDGGMREAIKKALEFSDKAKWKAVAQDRINNLVLSSSSYA
jgi:hypothetical protein